MYKDELNQVLENYSSSDPSGGRVLKVDITSVTADTVAISQTTPGTTNGVVVNSGTLTAVTAITNALPAGANVIGKVSIDQATPGTTNLVQAKIMPDATSTFCPTGDVSGALEASSVTKASPGVIYGGSGYNSGPAQFILFYNTTAVPANGAVTPLLVIKVPATSNFSFDTGRFGVFFSAGISWSNSTDASPFTKTLGAADVFFNVQYS